MSPIIFELAPPNFTAITEAGRFGPHRGNVIFHTEKAGQALVLKIYRCRKSPWRDFWGSVSHGIIEKKRGVSALERCQTERESLELWRKHGFDVPKIFDFEKPPWCPPHPFLWLEYLPGPRLFEVTWDEDQDLAYKTQLIQALAKENARRHKLALDLSQPLLLQEHPTTKHILVHEQRLVTIDLEGGYLATYPVLSAIAQELAAVLRHLWIGEAFDSHLTRAYLEAYTDHQLLESACKNYLSDSVWWRFKRRSDARRRPQKSKTNTIQNILQLLQKESLVARPLEDRDISRGQ